MSLIYALTMFFGVQARAGSVTLSCTNSSHGWKELYVFSEEKQTLEERHANWSLTTFHSCEKVKITPAMIRGVCESEAIEINRTNGRISITDLVWTEKKEEEEKQPSGEPRRGTCHRIKAEIP
jgi:hypothetical protein